MERWQNKVAVVVGASSGIGAAIAVDLAKNGVQVVGLARRIELVQKLTKNLPKESQHLLTGIYCDVTKLESVNKSFDEIEEKFGGVDILVYNSAKHETGLLVEIDPHILEDTVNTNIMGVVYCIQRAFKSMKERNVNGHVILMNGTTGHTECAFLPSEQGPVFLNMCSPTKHALKVMTEVFRQEFLRLGTKIKVTSISPGAVNTPTLRKLVPSYSPEGCLSPTDVSNAVIYALSTPPTVQVHEMIVKPIGDII